MKKVFFKLISSVLRWYNRFSDAEARKLAKTAIDQMVPNSNESLEHKKLASSLRQDGVLYHKASLRYLDMNPDKDFSDYDRLMPEEKAKYYYDA